MALPASVMAMISMIYLYLLHILSCQIDCTHCSKCNIIAKKCQSSTFTHFPSLFKRTEAFMQLKMDVDLLICINPKRKSPEPIKS